MGRHPQVGGPATGKATSRPFLPPSLSTRHLAGTPHTLRPPLLLPLHLLPTPDEIPVGPA